MKTYLYSLLIPLILLFSCEKADLDSGLTEGNEEVASEIKLAASKSAITVVGQNDPTTDPSAVQYAVDNYNRVTLQGEFDFGDDPETGGVDISRENVVLRGQATIRNGAKTETIPELGTVVYSLSVRAPGVQIRELEFQGNNDGIGIYVQEKGRPVVIYGNTVNAGEFGAAVVASATPGGIKVINNTLDAFFSYAAIETTGTTEIVHNELIGGLDCVFIFGFDHKLNIINNDMTNNGLDGVFIGSWRVTPETGPDWGDNPPVRILNNTIDVNGEESAGIIVGTSVHGINNTLVMGNTIRGNAGFSGLLKEPYGRNNRFINNDLSGLSTYGPQIWVMGGTNNHYQNNTLGSVVPIPGGGPYPALQDAATLVANINWHENDGLNSPDPLNYGNHFSNNDYRNTGVTGWSDDPASIGAVLLLDFLQKFDASGNPFEEPFVMKNFIAERKFPKGTDVCNQVLDLNPGSNHIAGGKACEIRIKRTPKMLASKQYTKFGQLAKERHQRRMEALKRLKE